jgi:hypothetical protein
MIGILTNRSVASIFGSRSKTAPRSSAFAADISVQLKIWIYIGYFTRTNNMTERHPISLIRYNSFGRMNRSPPGICPASATSHFPAAFHKPPQICLYYTDPKSTRLSNSELSIQTSGYRLESLAQNRGGYEHARRTPSSPLLVIKKTFQHLYSSSVIHLRFHSTIM